MDLAAAGEFALVGEIRRRLAARLARAPGVVLGPGDDCAICAPPAPGRELLLKTDQAIEGVHFDLRWLSPREVGRRAMTQNLSDLAAMAGEPRFAVLALAAPGTLALDAALEIVEGAAERAEEHGCALVGGNVTRAERVSVTIALTGDVEAGRAVLRRGARAGDRLYVTGEPGAARAGLLALQAGRGAEPDLAACVARWRDPRPRTAEARFLRDRAGARAMIDLSDGLAGDLEHLARESGVGARLERERLPVGAALARAARALGRDPRTLALEGGEDYELLLAAPADAAEPARAEFEARFGIALTDIGGITASGAVEIADERGGVHPLSERSYEHFFSGE